jgi:hypothetical protein
MILILNLEIFFLNFIIYLSWLPRCSSKTEKKKEIYFFFQIVRLAYIIVKNNIKPDSKFGDLT